MPDVVHCTILSLVVSTGKSALDAGSHNAQFDLA
jgi:hypothetical protein